MSKKGPALIAPQRNDDYYEYENYEIEIKYSLTHSVMNFSITTSLWKK